ncbi:MAG: tetratricopeptide repeat protein [Rhizobiaceae bacterium]
MNSISRTLVLAFVAAWFGILPTQAQFITHEVPLWEGVEKTDDDIANDTELVRKAIERANGDRFTAVRALVDIGWQRIGAGDPNHAIRAFNQASLIEPEFPDIFWGLAVATHIRGDELMVVERWISRTEQEIGKDARLVTDHGRILGERKMPEKAKTLFMKALAINPDYIPAHAGMIRVAQDLNDRLLEEKHQKRHDELTGKTQ